VSPQAVAGPLLVACGLLAVAGVAKAVSPHDTARALRRAGLPVGSLLVRAVAVAEATLGVAAAVAGGRVLSGAVSLSYAAFAVFIAVALSRGWALSSCGCFGEPDTPPTLLHVAVDLGLAAGAGLAAVVGGAAPLVLAARRPGWGTGLLVVSLVTGGLAYLVLARLPRLRIEAAAP